MTVTDELRKLLDERGVRWDYGPSGASSTAFWVNGKELSFSNCRDGLVCSTIFTPAQVIAATLGAADTKPDIADMSANVREVKVTTKANMWGFNDYFCGHCGRRLTSVANRLNEHFPVYCEDCGTKAVYE